MRRSMLVAIPSLIAVTLVLAPMSMEPAAEAAGVQAPQINITVTCDAGAVDEVSIRPWTARASRGAGDQVRWRLQPNSGVTSATIRPKSTSSWPFASNPPLTVNRNATVDSGAINGGPGTYQYDIVVDCGGGATVIDPRMDIRP